MKNLVLTITLILFSLYSVHSQSKNIPRFGTLHYDEVKNAMTQKQKDWLSQGYVCANAEYPTGVALSDNTMVPMDMVAADLLGYIATPIKYSPSSISPMLTFAGFFGAREIEICTIDQADVELGSSRNVNKLAVNWLLNSAEFKGSYTRTLMVEGVYSINVHMDLDIRSDIEYAFLNGIQHFGKDDDGTWVIGHYDTVWLQSFDYYAKTARVAWSDSKRLTHGVDDLGPVLLTMIGVPTTIGKNPDIKDADYEAGVIEFEWPEDTTSIGVCVDVKFQKKFEFTPFVFVSLEHDMNTETRGTTTWVEDVSEIGCKLCVSILAYLPENGTARILSEDQEKFFHYLAFTNIYTEQEIENSSTNAHCNMVIEGIKLDSAWSANTTTNFHNMAQVAKDTMQLINPISGDIQTKNFHLTEDTVEITFDDTDGHYLANTLTGLHDLVLDETKTNHLTYMNKYKTTNETKFLFNFVKYPVYSRYKADTQCSISECQEDAQSQQTVSTNPIPIGFQSDPKYPNGSPKFSISKPCNHGPCNIKSSHYHIYNQGNKYEAVPFSTGSGSSTTVIIIVVVVVIIVIIIIGAMSYYYSKKKKRSAFPPKTSAFKQMV